MVSLSEAIREANNLEIEHITGELYKINDGGEVYAACALGGAALILLGAPSFVGDWRYKDDAYMDDAYALGGRIKADCPVGNCYRDTDRDMEVSSLIWHLNDRHNTDWNIIADIVESKGF